MTKGEAPPKEAPATESTVLVIDDSDIARRSMLLAIRAAGISAIDLPTPIGATRVIVRHSVRLVVIDINMPSMRGDKLAALFRNSARLKDLKVVLVSGTEAAELHALAKDVRADGVVGKSEGNDKLVRVVQKLLESA